MDYMTFAVGTHAFPRRRARGRLAASGRVRTSSEAEQKRESLSKEDGEDVSPMKGEASAPVIEGGGRCGTHRPHSLDPPLFRLVVAVVVCGHDGGRPNVKTGP